jgi:hypothetical protein
MALVALTTRDMTPIRRIEGHTSNVLNPIYQSQSGTIVSATLAAGASFVIPHAITGVKHINITPLTAAGATSLYGAASGAATLGAYVDKNGYAVNWEAVGATAVLGATIITLGSSASAVADVYNGCTLDIELSNEIQTVKILDYSATTKLATIDTPVAEALTTSNKYRVRGSIYVSPTAATTPSFSVEVSGTLD